MPVIDKNSSNEPKQVILAAIFRKEPYKWAPGKSCPQLAAFDQCVKNIRVWLFQLAPTVDVYKQAWGLRNTDRGNEGGSYVSKILQ